MRDNVSIIFATIFAVILLIVLPLFSLLSRQDSIAYNKVLNLTTEFVDSIRTKGYFTEKEYSDYLVGLAATQNTYKVDMECHKKILIKDIEKYTEDTPVWIEDTAVYYNSYVIGELENSDIVSLEEGDEFYIKVYNTNITTASLMYNYFLNTRIPKKVINIGYGGKILDSTGDTFVKTTFTSSYTPYITFEEVVNSEDKEVKYCYDVGAGIYGMQECNRFIDLDEPKNNPIKVKFKMNNFTRIEDVDLVFSNFEDNKEYFINVLKENVLLRGDYIYSYDVEIEDLEYLADVVEGTIVIENISLGYGAWRTRAHIVIKAGVGSGPTGATSSEGTTEELVLSSDNTGPLVIDGPYLDKADDEIITSKLYNKETVYYKITLKDASTVKKLELIDMATLTTVASRVSPVAGDEFTAGDYKVKYEGDSGDPSVYWVAVTPTYSFDGSVTSKKLELELYVYTDTYTGLNVTSEVKVTSYPTTWELINIDIKCTRINYRSTDDEWIFGFADEFEESAKKYMQELTGRTIDTLTNTDRLQFFNELADRGTIYLSYKTGGAETQKTKRITFTKVERNSEKSYSTTFKEVIDGGFFEANEVQLNFKNSSNVIRSKIFEDIDFGKGHFYNNRKSITKSVYLNVFPNYKVAYSGTSLGIRRYDYGNVLIWIPADESNVDADSDAYYDSTVTKAMIKSSIKQYGGFYMSSSSWSSWSSGSNFAQSWESAVGRSNEWSISNEMFSSMAYRWQLNRLVELYGKYVPQVSGTGNAEPCFWIANRGIGERRYYARWFGENFSYDTFDSNRSNDDRGRNMYYFCACYIK